jgi:hypothetical protein
MYHTGGTGKTLLPQNVTHVDLIPEKLELQVQGLMVAVVLAVVESG